jgi:hypothetical protein
MIEENELSAAREALVAQLLTPIWRCIDSDYKRKYSMTIWSQFEAAIKACARERSMPLVLEKLCKKLPVEINGESAAAIAAVATSDDSAKMLRIMRTETTLLVVMVRLENEARKPAQFKKETGKK